MALFLTNSRSFHLEIGIGLGNIFTLATFSKVFLHRELDLLKEHLLEGRKVVLLVEGQLSSSNIQLLCRDWSWLRSKIGQSSVYYIIKSVSPSTDLALNLSLLRPILFRYKSEGARGIRPFDGISSVWLSKRLFGR